MSFEPITTQEAFDAAIQDRIARERAKYSDYDNLKAQLTTQQAEINTYKAAQAEHDKTKAGLEAQIADLNGQLAAQQRSAIKTRVALDAGLPFAMAERLAGETEDEIKADAQALVDMIGHNRPTPPLAQEPIITADGAKDAALKELSKKLSR